MRGALLSFTGEKFKMTSENFQKWILKRRMNKIDRWKPCVIKAIREEADRKYQKEYNEEIEKLNDEIYELKHLNSSQSKDIIRYKGKYEEYKELYDKLLSKHEAKTEKLGETKEKLNATTENLKEALDENTPLEENTDFNKELKILIEKCNDKKYNKAELMSTFSAKWNVSLKEISDDNELVNEFKWKEI